MSALFMKKGKVLRVARRQRLLHGEIGLDQVELHVRETLFEVGFVRRFEAARAGHAVARHCLVGVKRHGRA